MKTVKITIWRKKLNLLEAPLEQEEMLEGKRVVFNIKVSDSEYRGDIDDLNDLVSERITGSIVGLEDIDYKLMGVTSDGDLILRVSGVISEGILTD